MRVLLTNDGDHAVSLICNDKRLNALQVLKKLNAQKPGKREKTLSVLKNTEP